MWQPSDATLQSEFYNKDFIISLRGFSEASGTTLAETGKMHTQEGVSSWAEVSRSFSEK